MSIFPGGILFIEEHNQNEYPLAGKPPHGLSLLDNLFYHQEMY